MEIREQILSQENHRGTMWTYIFHVRPYSMAKLIFIGEKLVLEKFATYFILF